MFDRDEKSDRGDCEGEEAAVKKKREEGEEGRRAWIGGKDRAKLLVGALGAAAASGAKMAEEEVRLIIIDVFLTFRGTIEAGGAEGGRG